MVGDAATQRFINYKSSNPITNKANASLAGLNHFLNCLGPNISPTIMFEHIKANIQTMTM